MNCSKPIDAAVLADYWLALLGSSEEEAVEEHLLECDPCGQRLQEVMALAEGVRKLARGGTLRMIVSEVFLKQAAQDGLRVSQYDPPADGSVECTVTAEDDLLIGRFAANLSGVSRVDLCICDARGIEQVRMPDIPFRSDVSSVVYQESIDIIKAAPSNRMIARLVAVDDNGSERLLGEYTFNHTRSMPGPGAW